jgi:hypothetical protein
VTKRGQLGGEGKRVAAFDHHDAKRARTLIVARAVNDE